MKVKQERVYRLTLHSDRSVPIKDQTMKCYSHVSGGYRRGKHTALGHGELKLARQALARQGRTVNIDSLLPEAVVSSSTFATGVLRFTGLCSSLSNTSFGKGLLFNDSSFSLCKNRTSVVGERQVRKQPVC